ncbi:hypothetical protein AVEN_68501-1 [Araneus ventricosus]|uniref:Pre-C2HC domain-containing protein n=1 Tax=Araneus ventricosus TaxID=182803 RepID=A0A4Y2I5S0_ARAVE|nr:hypothetical protein AVEN_68501-1 [Araneus ventricosus]
MARDKTESKIKILPPMTSKTEVLIVRPKGESTYEATRNKLNAELVLKNLPVKIKKLNKISKSGFAVETDSDKNIDRLIETFKKSDVLNKSFDFSKPRKRHPQFILLG